MVKVRPRGEEIRRFILERVESHPSDIAKITAERFDISRQAVHKHLQKLKAERCLSESGHTRNRSYKLTSLTEWHKSYPIKSGLAEDIVWTLDVQEALGKLPDNVANI